MYRMHQPRLSTILKRLPLWRYDDVPWNWSPDSNERFNELKGVLSLAPVLAHYDPKLPLILSCGAAPVGVGGVLSDVCPEKQDARLPMPQVHCHEEKSTTTC